MKKNLFKLYKIVLSNIDLIELFHIFIIFIFILNVYFQFQPLLQRQDSDILKYSYRLRLKNREKS